MFKQIIVKTLVCRQGPARTIGQFSLALLIALTSTVASAANLAITFDERNISNINTIDDGAQWSGILGVPGFAATPNGSFALNSYAIELEDRSGAALLFKTGEPRNGVDGEPRIENDNSGNPWYLSNLTPVIPSIPNSFSFFIAVDLNGMPNTGHLLTLNTISGLGTGPNQNEGTWLLSALEYDGNSLQPLEIIRGGTYAVSAVPLPAALWLMLGATGALGLSRRKRE